MGNNLFVKLVLASIFLLYACTAVSFADSPYHVTGYVVDINGVGIPGAKVTLWDKNLVTMTDSSNPTTTDNSGMYKFDLSRLNAGDYQIVAEIGGKQSSTMLKVSGNYSDYTVKTIAITAYAVPSTGVPQKATPTATVAPTPTPTTTPAPTEAANATVAPPSPTATPVASSTPVPTPGLVFTLLPALLVICLIALKKRS